MSNPTPQPSVDAWTADKIIRLSEAYSELTALGKASNMRDDMMEKRIDSLETENKKRDELHAQREIKLAEEARAHKRGIVVEIVKAGSAAFFGGVIAALSGPVVSFFSHH